MKNRFFVLYFLVFGFACFSGCLFGMEDENVNEFIVDVFESSFDRFIKSKNAPMSFLNRENKGRLEFCNAIVKNKNFTPFIEEGISFKVNNNIKNQLMKINEIKNDSLFDDTKEKIKNLEKACCKFTGFGLQRYTFLESFIWDLYNSDLMKDLQKHSSCSFPYAYDNFLQSYKKDRRKVILNKVIYEKTANSVFKLVRYMFIKNFITKGKRGEQSIFLNKEFSVFNFLRSNEMILDDKELVFGVTCNLMREGNKKVKVSLVENVLPTLKSFRTKCINLGLDLKDHELKLIEKCVEFKKADDILEFQKPQKTIINQENDGFQYKSLDEYSSILNVLARIASKNYDDYLSFFEGKSKSLYFVSKLNNKDDETKEKIQNINYKNEEDLIKEFKKLFIIKSAAKKIYNEIKVKTIPINNFKCVEKYLNGIIQYEEVNTSIKLNIDKNEIVISPFIASMILGLSPKESNKFESLDNVSIEGSIGIISDIERLKQSVYRLSNPELVFDKSDFDKSDNVINRKPLIFFGCKYTDNIKLNPAVLAYFLYIKNILSLELLKKYNNDFKQNQILIKNRFCSLEQLLAFNGDYKLLKEIANLNDEKSNLLFYAMNGFDKDVDSKDLIKTIDYLINNGCEVSEKYVKLAEKNTVPVEVFKKLFDNQKIVNNNNNFSIFDEDENSSDDPWNELIKDSVRRMVKGFLDKGNAKNMKIVVGKIKAITDVGNIFGEVLNDLPEHYKNKSLFIQLVPCFSSENEEQSVKIEKLIMNKCVMCKKTKNNISTCENNHARCDECTNLIEKSFITIFVDGVLANKNICSLCSCNVEYNVGGVTKSLTVTDLYAELAKLKEEEDNNW